jgi:drug/metabolite transporter (DMT)-like permease
MTKKFNSQTLGAYGFLILAQVMVGINIVGAKYLVSSVPVLFILTFRFSLATFIPLLLHWLVDRHPQPILRHLKKLNKQDWLHLFLQAITAGVLFNLLMIWGLRYTNANVAGIITSGLPAMIAAMSWLVLREHFSGKKSVCVGLATIGLIIIGADKFTAANIVHQSFIGNLLIFFALLPEAAYYVLSKMHVNTLPVFLLSALISLINAMIMLPILAWQMDWSALHLSLFDGLILVLVSVSSALFLVFWYIGSYRVDGAMASLSTAIMPIATVIIAWLALGEVISFIQFLGMGLVVASIFVYAAK